MIVHAKTTCLLLYGFRARGEMGGCWEECPFWLQKPMSTPMFCMRETRIYLDLHSEPVPTDKICRKNTLLPIDVDPILVSPNLWPLLVLQLSEFLEPRALEVDAVQARQMLLRNHPRHASRLVLDCRIVWFLIQLGPNLRRPAISLFLPPQRRHQGFPQSEDGSIEIRVGWACVGKDDGGSAFRDVSPVAWVGILDVQHGLCTQELGRWGEKSDG